VVDGVNTCLCRDGFFPNEDSTACIEDCAANEVINLAGDDCIEDNACPVNSAASANDDGQMQCFCTGDNLVSADEISCVATCENDEFLSLDGKRCLTDCALDG